jgi:hypothetical protein
VGGVGADLAGYSKPGEALAQQRRNFNQVLLVGIAHA